MGNATYGHSFVIFLKTSPQNLRRTSFRIAYQLEGTEIRLEFFEPTVVLGRAKTCDVVVPLTGVSRNHAVIERDGEGWILADSNSTYGTFLNCERITRKRLSHGDKINLGPASRIPVTIRFELPYPPEPNGPEGVVFDEAAANVSMVINVEDFDRDRPALGSAGIIGLFSQVGERFSAAKTWIPCWNTSPT